MKNNKIGPTDTGRRSRIDMAEQEESDPVAAAVQAKKAREGSVLNNPVTSIKTGVTHDLTCSAEARIKAAAAAAAKAFAGKSKTVFFDTQGKTSHSCREAVTLAYRLSVWMQSRHCRCLDSPCCLDIGASPAAPAATKTAPARSSSETSSNPLASILGYE